MHHQTGSLRQQDIVVFNPQTNEVLGKGERKLIDSTSSHHFAKTITGGTSSIQTSGTINQNMNSTGGSNPIQPLSSQQQQQQQGVVYRGQEPNPNDGTITPNGSGGSSGGQKNQNIPGNNGERTRQIYNMSDCQLAQATVFLDRALICRRIRPRFNASEITEVLFEHLSPAIDKDSIRVEIRGAATILDVNYTSKSLTGEEDTWSNTVNELLAEKRQFTRQADNLLNRIGRAEKQRSVLETFADSLSRKEDDILGITSSSRQIGPNVTGVMQNHLNVSGPVNESPINQPHLNSQINTDHRVPTDTINPYDPKNIETLHRFLNIYKEEAERLDTTLLDTTEELEQVNNRIETIEKEIYDISLKLDEHSARELSVLVEPRETGQVEMLVSYVVTRCGWKPAYDIRIFNSDGTMKIVYYGMVQQATGEDWETRYMTLSTAQPGVGGTVPHLGLQRVHFRRDDWTKSVNEQPSYRSRPRSNMIGDSANVYSKRISSNAAIFYSPLLAQKSLQQQQQQQQQPLHYTECDELNYDPEMAHQNLTEHYTTIRRMHSTASSPSNRDSTIGHQNKWFRRSKSRETVRAVNQRDSVTPVGTLQRGGSMESGHSSGLRATNTRSVSRRTLGSSMLFNSVNNSNLLLPPPSPLSSNASNRLLNLGTTIQTNKIPPAGTIATIQLEVPRPPAIIRCDNEPNRVTVGLLDLQPRYEYVTVPKRSLHAYLKATAINNTDFSILSGPTNIYADNTFIGKSEIRAVAPGEEFSCDLGAENGVKIFYRPLFKYREGTGSSKNATMTFKQLIEVRNTFDRRIRLTVVDQVPLSGEDKIKVTLLEPVIKHPEKYDRNKPIRMNKSNNIEWDLDLGPGEVREITLKYSVEHPVNEDLDVSVSEN